MKIYHLVGSREDVGGVLTVIRSIQEASAGWGWRHVTGVHDDYQETRRPALEYKRSPFLLGESPSYFKMTRLSIRAFLEFRRDPARNDFDVLHFHSRGTLPMAVLTAAWLRQPVVTTIHCLPNQKRLYRWVAHRPRVHTVCVSRFVANHLRLAEDPRARVISACCRDSFFQGELARRRYVAGAPAPLRIASIGNIVRWKKWDLAIQSVAELAPEDRRRVQFTLWGPTQNDDDSRQFERELRELVARHKLEGVVQLPGSAPSVAGALRETDWVIHPTYNEPCAVSVIEALATGVPVLSPANGGPVEITGPGSLSFMRDDPRDLARQIRRVLNGEFAARSPAELRESVRHRSASEVARQYGELYQSVARRPS